MTNGRVLPTIIAVFVGIALASCDSGFGSSIPARDPLPGAAIRPPELETRLRDAVASQGSSYQPRARHRGPSGTPRYTNRLMLERSPYLRQHAHNPVDWYPWGEDAFVRAKADGKLILLSVGYATCHWCHVMEEESFEDEEIASYLNREYVAIKVDREERPDVDETYLRAVALLTGGGGWPMTVWLTPDREVFFAGTYFPARDGERGARLGFLTLLERFAASYRANPASIVAEGRALTARVHALADVVPAADMPGRDVLDAAFRHYQATFDRQHGGFGRAPKFPMPAALEFLLRYHRRTREPAALEMVTRTLEHLADGGIRDQLGGGFHRYATDAAWQIPHFEKMLYDNAQLASVYLAATQATGDAKFAEVTRGILDDLVRTLRAPGGAFHAAIDADDPGGEGAYYVWTPVEIDAVLEPASAAAARAYYGLNEAGNFDGKTVLQVSRPWSEVAAALGMDAAQLSVIVTKGRRALLSARAFRPAPLVDTKILAGWNGLAISAFARAGAMLGEPRYVQIAREAADFILAHMRPAGHLQRVYADGTAGQAAFLEDYAFLTAGFLDLYEATFDLRWLDEAERLQATLGEEFWDETGGAFFASGAQSDPALPRSKPADDGAVPSGNAVAAENLIRLATLTDDEHARQLAVRCVRGLGRGLVRAPTSAPRLLGVVEALLDRPQEIVIVAPANGGGDTSMALSQVVRARFLPNRALLVTREGADLAAARGRLPFVGEKQAIDGHTTAYVCERGRCLLPTSDPEVLARQLAAVHPLPTLEQGSD